MKKLITAATMALFLAAGLAPLQANDMMKKSPQEQQEHMKKHMDKMTKDLNLNANQQALVQKAMQDKMDKINTAMQDYKNTVRAALTPDQVKKFDAMEDKK